MPMSKGHVAALLGMMAMFDYRETDENDDKAWLLVIGDLSFEDAEQAIVDHYKTSGDRMKPVDVREGVAKIRKKRGDQNGARVGAGGDTEIPDADPDDVRGYIAAIHENRARTGEGRQPRPVAALLAGCRMPIVDAVTDAEWRREVYAQIRPLRGYQP